VNNAGIGKVGGVESAGFGDDVRQTLQASLFGMIEVTRRVLPVFRRRGRARWSTCRRSWDARRSPGSAPTRS
jgi:NAD(P)-dependent dehydrogenase (short-subunit alcohol dehydrogenase family)